MNKRIRTIKPEITESESFARCSIKARLTAIYLITNADDEGRMRGNAKMLARTLFPYDDDIQENFATLLGELESVGFANRYEVDGCQYLHIVNWSRHQRIDKPKPSRLPAPPTEQTNPGNVSDAPRTHPGNVRDASCEDLDQDLDQDQDHSMSSTAADARTMVDDPFERFKQAYPKRKGSQPWTPAKEKFKKACRDGVDPEVIIAGAKRYAEQVKRDGKINTEYVAQAKTWLNQRRWADDDDQAPPKSKVISITAGSPQWNAWRAYYSDKGNKFRLERMNACADKGKSFPVDSVWPPNHNVREAA